MQMEKLEGASLQMAKHTQLNNCFQQVGGRDRKVTFPIKNYMFVLFPYKLIFLASWHIKHFELSKETAIRALNITARVHLKNRTIRHYKVYLTVPSTFQIRHGKTQTVWGPV